MLTVARTAADAAADASALGTLYTSAGRVALLTGAYQESVLWSEALVRF